MKKFIKNENPYLKAESYKLRANQRGFIQIIILIIIALLILHFLGISLSSLLSMQSVHDFFVYLWGLTQIIWADFLLLLNFIKGIIAGK